MIDLGEFPEEYEEKPPSKVRASLVETRKDRRKEATALPLVTPLDDLPDPETVFPTIMVRAENDVSSLTASDKLETLTDTALKRLKEILQWDIPRGIAEKKDIEQVKLQLTAIGQVMTAQLKVDDNRLKKQSADMLPALLRELRDEERKLIVIEQVAHG